MRKERPDQLPTLSPDNLTWTEILKQGYFYSPPPQLLGQIPNSEEFSHALQLGLSDFAFPKGGRIIVKNPESSPDLPSFCSPIVKKILNYEESRGTDLSRFNINWLSGSDFVGSLPNAEPHIDASFALITKLFNFRPETLIRYSIATIGGTVFYPGYYAFACMDLPELPTQELVGTHNHFASTIESQAYKKKAFPTRALDVVRFDGLTVHSAPFLPMSDEERLLLTMTLIPTENVTLQ